MEICWGFWISTHCNSFWRMPFAIMQVISSRKLAGPIWPIVNGLWIFPSGNLLFKYSHETHHLYHLRYYSLIHDRFYTLIHLILIFAYNLQAKWSNLPALFTLCNADGTSRLIPVEEKRRGGDTKHYANIMLSHTVLNKTQLWRNNNGIDYPPNVIQADRVRMLWSGIHCRLGKQRCASRLVW